MDLPAELEHLKFRSRRESWDPEAHPSWSLETIAGRLVEIVKSGGTPMLTAAAGLILEAQRRGEPAAWIAAQGSTFFPPDFAASGIDLEALPVIRVEGSVPAAHAADALLRSGAFALVVIDLGPRSLPLPIVTRLTSLAKKHHTALLCLTQPASGAPALGSLVSLRGEGTRRRIAFDHFGWELHFVKDKRRRPGWRHVEVSRGPDGLC